MCTWSISERTALEASNLLVHVTPAFVIRIGRAHRRQVVDRGSGVVVSAEVGGKIRTVVGQVVSAPRLLERLNRGDPVGSEVRIDGNYICKKKVQRVSDCLAIKHQEYLLKEGLGNSTYCTGRPSGHRPRW